MTAAPKPGSTITLPSRAQREECAAYAPLERNLTQFRLRHAENEEAIGLAASIEEEIEVFRAHHEHYGYVFYVMRRDD